MLDINFGKIFGAFLDNLGKSFDGENSGGDDAENLKNYQKRRELISLIGNGRKGKFDLYGQKLFLFGTMRENWESELIEQYKSSAATQSKFNSENQEQRILQISEVKPEKSKISLSNVLKELKYWIYIVSWIVKLYVMTVVSKYP